MQTHQQVCVLQVFLPVGSDVPLASDVPDVQLHAVTRDALDVEALQHNPSLLSQQ